MQDKIWAFIANKQWDDAINHAGWQGMIQLCGSVFSMRVSDKQAEIITE